jgi:anti-anti-sigma regulatory factor
MFGDVRNVQSFEIGDSGVAPVIEEAAILYANKQGTAAAMILWQAIKEDVLGGASTQAWLMLFDLYQVLGRKSDFESLALDYAARFETSPPNWREQGAAPRPVAKPKIQTANAIVTLSPVVDINISRNLEIAQRAADKQRAITIDCSQIRRIDAAGAQMLLDLLGVFEQSERQLRISSTERLCAALRSSVEAGRRDDSQACWNLLLAIYRVARDEARYDEASIDFCVTYEVSPPQWKSPPPNIAPLELDLEQESANLRANAAEPEETTIHSAPARLDKFELKGEIDGSMDKEIAALNGHAEQHKNLAIDCGKLHRIDFVAAGQLLNAVATLRGKGVSIELFDLNHLVAALLVVMGLSDLSTLTLRKF